MEKFGAWRDKATGLQPFLPPKASQSSSLPLLAVLKYYSIGVVMALLKLVVLMAVVVVGVVGSVLGEMLVRRITNDYGVLTESPLPVDIADGKTSTA